MSNRRKGAYTWVHKPSISCISTFQNVVIPHAVLIWVSFDINISSDLYRDSLKILRPFFITRKPFISQQCSVYLCAGIKCIVKGKTILTDVPKMASNKMAQCVFWPY